MKHAHIGLAALFLLTCSSAANAKQMFRFDLQSLAYMSTAVIEGDVKKYEFIHWTDKLTIEITRVYAGDLKSGDTVVVGLSAYRQVEDALNTTRFGTGDRLILFIEPVTQEQWKEDGIPYWPVSSGLKLVAGGKVTGVQQMDNPGPYENTIDEGLADEFKGKVEAAVKWAAGFRKSLEQNRKDVVWLLDQLKERPRPGDDTRDLRDAIAIELCQAIADTEDEQAIARAKEIRSDRYERQLLDLPPRKERGSSR